MGSQAGQLSLRAWEREGGREVMREGGRMESMGSYFGGTRNTELNTFIYKAYRSKKMGGEGEGVIKEFLQF